MKLRWQGETAFADREYVATLYEVSPESVHRHCRAAIGYHEPRTGVGPGGGRAMYDVEACADLLEGITPRPETTLAAIRKRNAIARQRAADRINHQRLA